MPVIRFLNCVYAWCVVRLDEEKREQWDGDLIAPLPWEKERPPTQAQIEAEGEGFLAMMGMGETMEGAG